MSGDAAGTVRSVVSGGFGGRFWQEGRGSYVSGYDYVFYSKYFVSQEN